jgi:hypothetical protein
MHWIFIPLLGFAMLTGFGCGWAACDEHLKGKIMKLSSSNLVKWASQLRREKGL